MLNKSAKISIRLLVLMFVLLSFSLYRAYKAGDLIEKDTHPVAIERIKHNEKYYIEQWSREHQGSIEYSLPDRTRVDVVTNDYAVEVDFASKWYEAIGQSLHYALQTGKKPGIVLIIRNEKDLKYMDQLLSVIKEFSLPIAVWKIESDQDRLVYDYLHKRGGK